MPAKPECVGQSYTYFSFLSFVKGEIKLIVYLGVIVAFFVVDGRRYDTGLNGFDTEHSLQSTGSTQQVARHRFRRADIELISMLSSQEIDLTFSCDPQAIKEFPCYEIFDDHILFAVPDSDPFNREHEDKALTAADIINRKHLEPDCRKITIEEVSEEEIILLRKGNNLQERVLEMYKKSGLKAKVKFDLNQLVTAYHMAEAGLGATFTSDRVVTNENSSLKFYALADPLAKRTFNLLLPKNTYTPIAVQRFIELSKRK